MTEATIPHSREAEEAVIGSVIFNPDAYYDVAQFLEADDFYIHRNKWIWEAYTSLNEKRVPVDILTVADELERHGRLGEIGGASYLTALTANVYDSNNAEHYARIVEGHAIRRKMINAANETAKLAYNTEIDADEALNKAHEQLQTVTPSSRGNKMSLADRILEQVTIAGDKFGEITGIPTGLKSLNTLTDGWKESDLVIIAARPGMGKTGLLLTHTRAALAAGKSVAFFSLEMGDLSVGQRLIAQEKNIDLFNLRRGRMSDDEYSLFNGGLEWLRNQTENSDKLHIVETSGMTPEQVHAEAKRLYVRGLCDLVVVDYVQLMSGRGDNRTQEVGYCSRGLKRIANDLHIPVLSAAQLNRDIEKRSSPKPVLSDLRESGDIEADADLIIFIWAQGERVTNAQIDPANITVAKHRNGPVGDLVSKNGAPLVEFVRKSTLFRNV
jgi:replicative DNA helicase